MSNISSDKIKSLREKTGAGIMDCKNALVENNGEVENAIDWLRKKGIAKANKKASRIAAEGLIGISSNNKKCFMIEVNSETDFVSKNKDFQHFIENLLHKGLERTSNLEEFLSSKFNDDYSVKDALNNIIAKIGENIVIRRLVHLDIETDKTELGIYIHNKATENLGKIGCVVSGSYDENNENIPGLLKKIAMHVSASKPIALSESILNDELIERERSIFSEQLINSGKPREIINKIVDGKIKKFISEITLLNQSWILDPSKTVAEVIEDFNNEFKCCFKILDYKLFVLGEGVETNTKDFKEEVASQISDSK